MKNKFYINSRDMENDNKDNLNWRHTITTMTDTIFPGLSNKVDENVIDNEVMSNLPLQMALYFNVVLAPVWFIVLAVYLIQQFPFFSELYKFITIMIIVILWSIEILRLYLGYEGNLRDQIPELAGFWMLSVLLQFPLQTFLLLNPHFKLRITEMTVQFIMNVLLIVQLFAGYNALKYTAKKQALYVRIMNLNTHIPGASRQKKYKMN